MSIGRLARHSPRIPHLLFAVFALAGCKPGTDPALAKVEAEEAAPNVPTPPADGPRLLVLRDMTPVLDRPSPKGAVIGELAAGATVARSREPYGRKECPGGWYAIRPRGFVCAGITATLELALGHALPSPPDLNRPLPYRYGRARTEGVPLYNRVPTPQEQVAEEPDLRKALKAHASVEKEPLFAGANDVPLDARAVPSGPPVLMPGGEGIDPSGRRSVGSYFVFVSESPLPLLPILTAAPEPRGGTLRKGSGVAVTASFTADLGAPSPRRFGLTPSGHVVPLDRLRPALGSTWHGIDLEKVGLPVAFVHKAGAFAYDLHRGKANRLDEEFERRTAVALTGKFRTIEGIRYEEAREGYWLRSQDLIVIVRRSKFPDFAKGNRKWLDVSIVNQTLTAYEGQKPVYATLVSSGRDRLKEGSESASTVRGTFPIRAKYVTRRVDSREVQNDFDVSDAPWVMEFEPTYALMGSYWGDGMGEAQGHHNIALTPIDAHKIWTWSDPQLPEGWHGIVGEGTEPTMVNVRP